jgi:hypothetical protein
VQGHLCKGTLLSESQLFFKLTMFFCGSGAQGESLGALFFLCLKMMSILEGRVALAQACAVPLAQVLSCLLRLISIELTIFSCMVFVSPFCCRARQAKLEPLQKMINVVGPNSATPDLLTRMLLEALLHGRTQELLPITKYLIETHHVDVNRGGTFGELVLFTTLANG